MGRPAENGSQLFGEVHGEPFQCADLRCAESRRQWGTHRLAKVGCGGPAPDDACPPAFCEDTGTRFGWHAGGEPCFVQDAGDMSRLSQGLRDLSLACHTLCHALAL